jgi:putative hemolysin
MTLLFSILLLLLASACFSGAEAALFTLASRPAQRHSSLVARMLDNRGRVLTVILFANLVVNLSFFASTYALAKPLSVAQSASVNAVAILLIVLIGEITPKLVARRHPIYFARISLPIVQLCYWLFDPIIRFLPNIKNEDPHSPQPIQSSEAVDLLIGKEDVLEQQEETFLSRFLELGELRAGALRRPLQDYLLLAPHLPLALALRRMSNKGVAWAAIVDEREQVVGVLDRTRILQGNVVSDAMHSVPILPEVAPVAAGLQLLKANGGPFVLLVDEYGDSAGVIDRGRWADTLLNRMPMANATGGKLITKLNARHYRIDAAIALHEFADYFGEAQEIDVRVDTVAGFIQEKLGRIAIVGDTIEMDTASSSLILTVVEASETRVLVIELEVLG